MAQVKGTAVLASLRYVRERFGEESLQRVLAALPGSDAALGTGLLASSWYPMPALLRFMQEAERQLGGSEPDLALKMGRASCDYFCERIYGWMQRTLELAGARNLRTGHTACVHRGDAACRFEGNWD